VNRLLEVCVDSLADTDERELLETILSRMSEWQKCIDDLTRLKENTIESVLMSTLNKAIETVLEYLQVHYFTDPSAGPGFWADGEGFSRLISRCADDEWCERPRFAISCFHQILALLSPFIGWFSQLSYAEPRCSHLHIGHPECCPLEQDFLHYRPSFMVFTTRSFSADEKTNRFRYRIRHTPPGSEVYEEVAVLQTRPGAVCIQHIRGILKRPQRPVYTIPVSFQGRIRILSLPLS